MSYFLANSGGILPISQGGTNATSTSVALTNLGIKSVIDSLGQTTNGKFVLPNGLKICWGTAVTSNMNGYYRGVTVTFPITFTSAPTVIITKTYSTNSTTEAVSSPGVGGITTTTANLRLGYGGGNATDMTVSYIAIGY